MYIYINHHITVCCIVLSSFYKLLQVFRALNIPSTQHPRSCADSNTLLQTNSTSETVPPYVSTIACASILNKYMLNICVGMLRPKPAEHRFARAEFPLFYRL